MQVILPYGKQRKLEIARGLATNPKTFALDEPAAGMNPNETAELMDTIRLVRDRYQITILLIEHDMKLVYRYLRTNSGTELWYGTCSRNAGRCIKRSGSYYRIFRWRTI